MVFIGCGRFFEGTAEEMHTALNKSLASIPDDTKVYVSYASPRFENTANINSRVTNIPKQTSSLLLQFHKVNQSRSFKHSQRIIRRPRGNLQLLTRRYKTPLLGLALYTNESSYTMFS